MGTRFTVEFEGITLRCEQEEDGDIIARTDLPSGLRLALSFENAEELRLLGRLDPGKVYCPWVLEEDLAVLNRLTCRATVDIGEPGRPELRIFWRPQPELALAIRSAAPLQVTGPAPAPGRDPLAWSETLALLDLECTPMAPAAVLARGRRRTCVECGSVVYGDHCTHCMEG